MNYLELKSHLCEVRCALIIIHHIPCSANQIIPKSSQSGQSLLSSSFLPQQVHSDIIAKRKAPRKQLVQSIPEVFKQLVDGKDTCTRLQRSVFLPMQQVEAAHERHFHSPAVQKTQKWRLLYKALSRQLLTLMSGYRHFYFQYVYFAIGWSPYHKPMFVYTNTQIWT